MRRLLLSFLTVAAVATICPPISFAWHDATHMAVVKAAGLDDYAYLAVGADMAKEKAGEIEGRNHYYNNPRGGKITPALVMAQVGSYNSADDASGHLYGAIVAAVNDFVLKGAASKYARYPLGYAAHYIGDLSMPFHNMAYDDFNRAYHSDNDGVVERTGPKDEPVELKVNRLATEIRRRLALLPPLTLPGDLRGFYRELAKEIATLGSQASALGYAIEESVPPRTLMTEEEAYTQLARSARLLKAIAAVVVP